MLCRRSNGFVLIGGLGATRADGGTPSAFAPPERCEFQIFLGKKFGTHNAGASPFVRWLSILRFARAVVCRCEARFAVPRSLSKQQPSRLRCAPYAGVARSGHTVFASNSSSQ